MRATITVAVALMLGCAHVVCDIGEGRHALTAVASSVFTCAAPPVLRF